MPGIGKKTAQRLVLELKEKVDFEDAVGGGPDMTEIAQDAGYDNASKFARAFRDVIGVSPREYRAGAEYDSCAPQLGEKPVSLSDADVERRI